MGFYKKAAKKLYINETILRLLLVVCFSAFVMLTQANNTKEADMAYVLAATDSNITVETKPTEEKKQIPKTSQQTKATPAPEKADPVKIQPQTKKTEETASNSTPSTSQSTRPAPAPATTSVVTTDQRFAPGSVGQTYNTNAATRSLLARMGQTEQSLWIKGVKILPYNGLVRKRCALNSTTSVSGLAVKHNAVYPACPNGQEVIYPEYRTNGKCTVIYDWTKHNLPKTAKGNSYAVLVHEIGHCLHFLRGEGSSFDSEYIKRVRPELALLSKAMKREVIADDIMTCRFGANTSWSSSYYSRAGVSYLSASKCSEAKQLYNQYLGI